MAIRVVVADDQAAVREALRMVLDGEPDIEVVGEAASGAEAVHVTLVRRPDVVVMDLRMPHGDGIAAITRLSGARPEISAPEISAPEVPAPEVPAPRILAPKILALTTFDVDEYLFGALAAGAGGFLLKDSDPALLLEAVRGLHEGRGLIDPKVTGRLIARFAQLSPRPAPSRVDQLTAREREVLAHVVRGLSNAEIAGALTIEEGTVKTHVARILTKLGLRTRVHAVIYAYEHGLAQ
ncbi:DNA-binding NarL/FixJ family response regulator [Saccharothrix saharensis]|uniref:DNA-binding NarL/FixJ family response regulator n=1 Tax=Saccharothrix saharensis TaxID=571190 RepID=A0A543JDB6_9PSEU|nr:response regulator transcription factor [Saccharothrix saharensis]TQM80839.1 DNA-binding NarL/FixJ family response regulator [Saccharothrix saharensis]